VKGFTLLEVMISLAIMAGVLLTVITTMNSHLNLVSREREETIAVLLARAKLDEPGFRDLREKKGTFAPVRPDISWERESYPTDLPMVSRLVLTVKWGTGKEPLTLVQYVTK
jgi:general secretion pathway protein I